jgi:PDZ domain-containing protein
MKAKVIVVLILMAGGLAAMIALFQPRNGLPGVEPRQQESAVISNTSDMQPQATVGETGLAPAASLTTSKPAKSHVQAEASITATNKLERLAQIREIFHGLAAGDPAAALQAAKQIKDETERETALLTLVTEWTHGELRPPRERASDIGRYGLEAGLGMELAKNPELALTWASELPDGPGRQALLANTAIEMTGSDPAAAFALGDQIPEDQRRKFFDTVFAGWADKDTEAALQWANQLPDPAERDAAIQAIRTEAPVGIGTALSMKDGYPVVQKLLPGTPAELSGQIHPGDRILALAQGDNAFVDAHGIALADLVQMIRGAPGTAVQLQVLSADAPLDSMPRTISIVRDQIKYKN